MNRRTVVKGLGAGACGALATALWPEAWATAAVSDPVQAAAKALREAGLDPVSAVLDGQAYRFDPSAMFPTAAGIVDATTGHSFYFHAHRAGEYGHFHTFGRDEYGLAVHLAMITMDERGRAVALSTVNQWVTGDRHVAADRLTPLLDQFSIAPASFVPPALVSFVTGVVKANRALIVDLFKERDDWVADYKARKGTDPYGDMAHEVLSTRAIGPLG